MQIIAISTMVGSSAIETIARITIVLTIIAIIIATVTMMYDSDYTVMTTIDTL